MANDWRDCSLGDVIELKRGYDLPQHTRHAGSVPVVSSSGISGTHSAAMARAPGVVTGRYGTIGEVFYVTQDFWPLNTTLYVRDFKGSDPQFVSYFLKTVDFYSCSDKAAVPGVNRNHLHELRVRVPPLPTQRAIAHVLGALDDKIELNRKTNETLEAMARALFQSWFVDFDPVRAKAAGRAPEGMDEATAKLFPSEFEASELGEVPKGWRVGTIGEWIKLQRGTTYKSSLLEAPGPVLLGLASIRRDGGFRSDSLRTYGGDSADKLLVAPGDLFVSLKDVTQSGDLLGAVARLPSWILKGRLTQDTIRLDFETDGGRRLFIYWLLRHPRLRALCRARATGTTNLGLAREDFLSFQVVMPPAEVISRLMPHISRVTFAAEDRSESASLAALRDALLPKLLSGELAIRDAETFVSRAV